MEKIDLSKTVYNKASYNKIIDTSFNYLGTVNIVDTLQNQPTVEEFFELYNTLFYDIPEEGDSNSHEYLINQSSEYINFTQNNEEIEELQKEISQLRTELLDCQKQLLESQTGINIPD